MNNRRHWGSSWQANCCLRWAAGLLPEEEEREAEPILYSFLFFDLLFLPHISLSLMFPLSEERTYILFEKALHCSCWKKEKRNNFMHILKKKRIIINNFIYIYIYIYIKLYIKKKRWNLYVLRKNLLNFNISLNNLNLIFTYSK